MAEKRRDSKGRILRTGESQRKDGRYAYKYTDSTGNSQLARRFIMALPRELSREEQIRLMREYCQVQFVSKGMIADFRL